MQEIRSEKNLTALSMSNVKAYVKCAQLCSHCENLNVEITEPNIYCFRGAMRSDQMSGNCWTFCRSV